MNNREHLSNLIKDYLNQNNSEIPENIFGWLERNNDADVYHNFFSRMFLDIQNFYLEIRDSYKMQDIQNGYDSKFQISDIRVSTVLSYRMFLRGIWHDFLKREDVKATFSISLVNLNHRSVVINVAGADIFAMFDYQKDLEHKKHLFYHGIFDLSNFSKTDREGFMELHL